MSRVHPSVDLTHISPNHSSRHGRKPSLIVLHATVSHNKPGLRDLRSLGDFFGTSASRVSAHVCTDAEGNSGRYVWDKDKAWHCRWYNSPSLGIEQVWFPGDAWTPDQVRETARWVAQWSKKYNIPIRVGNTFGGIVTKSGVVTHRSLGRLGGGHTDPAHYPMTTMLSKAKWYRSQL